MRTKKSIETLLNYLDRIYVPSRQLVREAKGRFKIYLPNSMRRLWELLHSRGKRIDIIIFISDEEEES